MKKNYITFEEVVVAYFDCRRHKRNTKQQLEFEINLWDNLYRIYLDLNRLNYTLQESIAFIVKRPVYREVFAAKFRDRIVHHILYNKVNHIFEEHIFIDNCYACRKGKGTLYGIKKCSEYIRECSCNYTKTCYIFKGDLKSFFMNIDKHRLYKITLHVINKYGEFSSDEIYFIDYLLKLIIFNCPQNNCVRRGNINFWKHLPSDKSLFNRDVFHGLPIGNLMSQILANLFLSVLDWYIVKELGCKYYGRYVDDFYIIHEDKDFLLKCRIKISHKLVLLGCTLHPKKNYLQHYTKGVQFLGAVIKPYRIYIINRTKGSFYDKVQALSKQDSLTNKEILAWRNSINSYLGLLCPFNTYNIRRKMVTKYDVLKCGYYYMNNKFQALKIKTKYKNICISKKY